MASFSDVSCSNFFASDILVDIEVKRNITKTAISAVKLAFSHFMDAVSKPGTMADESDEEDLEALRLAALQSIKSKPTVVAPRRRPKPIGRPNRIRNFYRGCVNTNLISIVPMDNPLEQNEPLAAKPNDPPPLVLPQDRYCKTEVKFEPAGKETQVSTKFSRFEDSNSGDSDDDLDDEFDDKSSDSDHQCETTEKPVKPDADDPDGDDDELLLQDEDSLGKFFNEFEEESEEKDKVKSPSAKFTSQFSGHKKSSEKVLSVPRDSHSSNKDKEMTSERPSVKRNADIKTSISNKKVYGSSETVNCKEESSSLKNHQHDVSPNKKALIASEEDGKRINRPCIVGRNRSPSPIRGKQDHFEMSPSHLRKRNNSPLKRRPSPPSPGSLSPFYKRETQLMRLSQGKSSHPPRSLPSKNSPQDITPPSYWGSRSNSNHGYSHALTSREWSSSPHKWSGPPVPGSFSDPPCHSSKNISPPQQLRTSKSPPHRGSRVRRSSDRDWSVSPPLKRCRDLDTPPESLRFVNDGNKASRRKSTSPTRMGERSRQMDRVAEVPFPRRFSPVRKSSRSPIKMRRSRSRSPIRSLSRTPSLSPSPDREGKSSAGNYRRHKSPLRLPGYRQPVIRDGRPFRQDGKANRKDSDRQRVMRLNGPTRKTSDIKLEISKVRPLSSKTENKSSEPTVKEKVDIGAKDVVRAKSPPRVPPPSSWSSDEGGESDSESRFKGSDTKVLQPTPTPPKSVPSTLKVRELEESPPPGKKSPKKKKSKRSKKIFSKSKGKDNSPDEPKAKMQNDDLRAELSRRRAERVSKAKSTNPSVPVRLVQSAFQCLTSKSNSIDGERSTLKSFAAKNDAGDEVLISKKKPIHMRLGLPVARNPDPLELPVLAGSLLPRISGVEEADGSDPNAEGGNKWRKVKLKRSVTVQKSLSRGTPTNASGKEQV